MKIGVERIKPPLVFLVEIGGKIMNRKNTLLNALVEFDTLELELRYEHHLNDVANRLEELTNRLRDEICSEQIQEEIDELNGER